MQATVPFLWPFVGGWVTGERATPAATGVIPVTVSAKHETECGGVRGGRGRGYRGVYVVAWEVASRITLLTPAWKIDSVVQWNSPPVGPAKITWFDTGPRAIDLWAFRGKVNIPFFPSQVVVCRREMLGEWVVVRGPAATNGRVPTQHGLTDDSSCSVSGRRDVAAVTTVPGVEGVFLCLLFASLYVCSAVIHGSPRNGSTCVRAGESSRRPQARGAAVIHRSAG